MRKRKRRSHQARPGIDTPEWEEKAEEHAASASQQSLVQGFARTLSFHDYDGGGSPPGAGLSVTSSSPIAAADPDTLWSQSSGWQQNLTFTLVSGGNGYFAIASDATTTSATSGATTTC